MADAITYSKGMVLENMDLWEKRTREKMDLIRAKREDKARHIIDRVRRKVDHNFVANYIKKINDAAQVFEETYEGDIKDEVKALFSLNHALTSSEARLIEYGETGALNDVDTSTDDEVKFARELEIFNSRRRLIDQADGDAFTITMLERLGVLRYFK